MVLSLGLVLEGDGYSSVRKTDKTSNLPPCLGCILVSRTKAIPSLLLLIFSILDKGTGKWVRPVSHSPTSIHPWSSRAEAVGEAEGGVHGAFSVGEKKTMRQIET